MRLDKYLADNWPEYSRSQWQKYLTLGYVMVDGVVERSAKRTLGEDDIVTVNLPTPQSYSSDTLPVIYENDDVIVIDKPVGILTHAKGVLTDEFSVAEYMSTRTTDQPEGNRPGIVHRLDRDTSGVIIAAKNTEAKRFLQKQFQDRKAKKTYIAVVDGMPKHDEAYINLPIERNPKEPSRFRVGAQGKEAQTHYKLLASNGKYSLIRLTPVTGRTHQLRVHLAHIGIPIVGDRFYNASKSSVGRLCLHAEQLEITLPSRNRHSFSSPIPPLFHELIRVAHQ